jgi:hypothetical protein
MRAHPALATLARLGLHEYKGRRFIARDMDMAIYKEAESEGDVGSLPPGDVLIVGRSWRADVNKDTVCLLVDKEMDAYYVLSTARVGVMLDLAYMVSTPDLNTGIARLRPDILADLSAAMQQSACGLLFRSIFIGAKSTSTPTPPPADPVTATESPSDVSLADPLIDWLSDPQHTAADIEAMATVRVHPMQRDALAEIGVRALRLAAALVMARLGGTSDTIAQNVALLAAASVRQAARRITLRALDKETLRQHVLAAHSRDFLAIYGHTDASTCIADGYMTSLDCESGDDTVPIVCLVCQRRAAAQAAEQAQAAHVQAGVAARARALDDAFEHFVDIHIRSLPFV